MTKQSNNQYMHLVFFEPSQKNLAIHYCQIKNQAGGRIFAVCRSPVSGKWMVADLGTAIRLEDWYEVWM